MSMGVEQLERAFAEYRRTGLETDGAVPDSPAAATANTAAEPSAPSAPLFECHALDFAARGCHLDVATQPDGVVPAARLLDRLGFTLDTITGVDWLAQNQMEVVYDYFHAGDGTRVAVRARVPRERPELPTISSVYPGANWHERETHDFFGIVFEGHPNLTPFLLPEEATFHPLRKDYVP